MLGGIAIGILVGAFLYLGGLAALFGFASYFSNRAFGNERLPVGSRMPVVYYRDALSIGVCGAVGFLGLRHLMEFAIFHLQTVHRSLSLSFGQNFDARLPVGAIFGGAVISSLFVTGLIAFIAAFVSDVLKARWLRFGIFLLGAMFLAGGDWATGADFAKQFLAEAILLGVIVFGVSRVIRFNVLGCLLIVALLALLGAAVSLLEQPEAFYRANGYAVIVMMLVLLAWPLLLWRMRASPTTT
jgi:hypothetical protein